MTPRPSGIEFGGSMSRSSKLAWGFNLVRPFAKSKQNRQVRRVDKKQTKSVRSANSSTESDTTYARIG
jgi:hypothetical protein